MCLDVLGSGRGITFYMRLIFLLKERYFEYNGNGASFIIYATCTLINCFLFCEGFSNHFCFL